MRGPRRPHGRRHGALAALLATALATPLLLTSPAASAEPTPAAAHTPLPRPDTATDVPGPAAHAPRPPTFGHGADTLDIPRLDPGAGYGHPLRGARLAERMVERTTGADAMRHLEEFQRIADKHDGNRASGTDGYDASATYVGELLEEAGYDVTYQEMDFSYREAVTERLSQRTPEDRDIAVRAMSYTANSPEGGVTAELAEVRAGGAEHTGTGTGTGTETTVREDVAAAEGAGCAPGDFDDRVEGRIALIERGMCTFAEKQANAAEAGAIGVLIYNNEEGPLGGTLGGADTGRVPTGGISRADGVAMSESLAAGETVTVDMELRELAEDRRTVNVIAETPGGDAENVVMAGAHLDSVLEGPGINDNGSGAAGVLETALRFAETARIDSRVTDHRNTVRFAFWGAEELGLLGAEHYVGELDQAERDRIGLYLNFDMIASPNYGLFVYDGDGSEGLSAPGPEGSAQIEHAINTFLRDRDEEPRPTSFNGRSDYGPFIAAGIPAGGTFTGAEGLKTEAQAELWGGEAGEPYDPCYHAACDDLDNVDPAALDINVRVIAHLVGGYAWDTGSLTEPVPESRPVKPETADSGGPSERATHRIDR
ncbi:M28 family metallopeptidase [Streptomyces sp. SM12]|uniref:M28 family metallopeptidase n=1 Tax=Streptomyces sp. SM12 TaxID=1071602 RepID=UPI0021561C4B|nr:M28 family peptidase [Streptomyces sp. SM12]